MNIIVLAAQLHNVFYWYAALASLPISYMFISYISKPCNVLPSDWLSSEAAFYVVCSHQDWLS